jgi:hypothetical protein
MRYSPAVCIGCEMKVAACDPDPKRGSTSYAERQNWTVRTTMRRYTRLSNGLRRKMENHAAAGHAYETEPRARREPSRQFPQTRFRGLRGHRARRATPESAQKCSEERLGPNPISGSTKPVGKRLRDAKRLPLVRLAVGRRSCPAEVRGPLPAGGLGVGGVMPALARSSTPARRCATNGAFGSCVVSPARLAARETLSKRLS